MSIPSTEKKEKKAAANGLSSLVRGFASVKLAVLLIVVLAVVLAAATFLESWKGREYSQWYVYGSVWFAAILGLLGISVMAAILIRFPWKPRHIGFLVTHVGILVFR